MEDILWNYFVEFLNWIDETDFGVFSGLDKILYPIIVSKMHLSVREVDSLLLIIQQFIVYIPCILCLYWWNEDGYPDPEDTDWGDNAGPIWGDPNIISFDIYPDSDWYDTVYRLDIIHMFWALEDEHFWPEIDIGEGNDNLGNAKIIKYFNNFHTDEEFKKYCEYITSDDFEENDDRYFHGYKKKYYERLKKEVIANYKKMRQKEKIRKKRRKMFKKFLFGDTEMDTKFKKYFFGDLDFDTTDDLNDVDPFGEDVFNMENIEPEIYTEQKHESVHNINSLFRKLKKDINSLFKFFMK